MNGSSSSDTIRTDESEDTFQKRPSLAKQMQTRNQTQPQPVYVDICDVHLQQSRDLCFSSTLVVVSHVSFSFLLNRNTSKSRLRIFFFLFKKTCLICWANINIWSLLRKFEGSNFIKQS